MTNAHRSDAATNGSSALQAESEQAEATRIDEGDGRSLRRKRNRDAVISALIDLIQEGNLTPTVAKIADRAAVSHRSVFRYFDDLNDLARTAIETEFRKTWPLSVITNVGEGPLDERIDALAPLIDTLATSRFRQRINDMAGYDLGDAGLATLLP